MVQFLRKASDLVKKRTDKTDAQNLMTSNCTESRTFRQDIWGLYSFYLVKIF